MRPLALLFCLVAGALLEGCTAGTDDGDGDEARSAVVGHWRVRTVDDERVGELTFRVEFAPDGWFTVVGPCHRSRGQYFRTERGAQLQAVEVVEETSCSEVGRQVTARIRDAVGRSARVSLRAGDAELVFYDRRGGECVVLQREQPPDAAGPG